MKIIYDEQILKILNANPKKHFHLIEIGRKHSVYKCDENSEKMYPKIMNNNVKGLK